MAKSSPNSSFKKPKDDPTSQLTKISNIPSAQTWGDDEWGDDGDDPWGASTPKDLDYNTYDLNKLDDTALKKEKAKMDVGFEKNQLRPGDAGYIYDTRKDFSQVEKVDDSWDD